MWQGHPSFRNGMAISAPRLPFCLDKDKGLPVYTNQSPYMVGRDVAA
jgi:hypothetical protein